MELNFSLENNKTTEVQRKNLVTLPFVVSKIQDGLDYVQQEMKIEIRQPH